MRGIQVGFVAFAAALLTVVLLVPTGSGAQPSRPLDVKTTSDAARAKLDRKLKKLVDSGTNKRVAFLPGRRVARALEILRA